MGTYRIVGVLDECVDGKESQVGLTLGVVDQVQVDQLLQLEVVYGAVSVEDNQGCKRFIHHMANIKNKPTSLDAVDDVCEKGGHVLADGHVGDNLSRKRLLGMANNSHTYVKNHTFFTASRLRSR